MKTSKQQLRKIIREAFVIHEGYTVPDFPNSASMENWVDELVSDDPDAPVEQDVVDPETGEIVIHAGESARVQEWWVETAVSDPEGAAPEEGYFDWDAYDAEMEAKEEQERVEEERIQDMVTQQAVVGGEEWASDTLYGATRNPNMWQNEHDSAEAYVSDHGQSAAMDSADNFLQYGEPDVAAWYESLPDREDEFSAKWSNRPTKTVMREIVADYFYDGVAKALEKQKKVA